MLWCLAFERVGVVMSDLYFVNPAIDQGEAGAERGVRLELRLFDREELQGSVSSAVPIRVGRPIWRVDLLETVDSEPGSLNRAHHHPRFDGWETGRRVFEDDLTANPVEWVGNRFEHAETVLDEAGLGPSEVGPNDVASLRAAGPAVIDQLHLMLGEVAAGRAALPPDQHGGFVRQGWL